MTKSLYKTITDQVLSIIRENTLPPFKVIDLKTVIRDLGVAGQLPVENGEIALLHDPEKLAVVNVNLSPSEVLDLVLTNQSIRHLITFDDQDLEQNLQNIVVMNFEKKSLFTDPITLLLGVDESRVSSRLSRKPFCYRFNSISQKSDLLRAVEEYVKTIPHGPRRLGDILFVCDELFTNGVIHGSGNSMCDRKNLEGIQLADGKEALLILDHQDGHLMMGCVDPGGLLEPNKILTQIRRCYSLGPEKAIQSTAGAGIGLWKVFNQSDSFYLGAIPGQASLVFSRMRLARGGEKRGPQLHLLGEERRIGMNKMDLGQSKNLKKLIELIQSVSLKQFKEYANLPDSTLEVLENHPRVLGTWTAFILVASHCFRLTFKTHFTLTQGKNLAGKTFKRFEKGPNQDQILDFMKEYCNLTAGILKLIINTQGADMGASLPLLTPGFDELFDKKPNEANSFYPVWKICSGNSHLVCSVFIEVLDEKAFEKFNLEVLSDKSIEQDEVLFL